MHWVGVSICSIPAGVGILAHFRITSSPTVTGHPTNSTTSFVPYITPAFIPTFADNTEMYFAVGLGVDIKFGTSFSMNVGGSFGDLDGISASFSWLH